MNRGGGLGSLRGNITFILLFSILLEYGYISYPEMGAEDTPDIPAHEKTA
jgi:hypothetical protein